MEAANFDQLLLPIDDVPFPGLSVAVADISTLVEAFGVEGLSICFWVVEITPRDDRTSDTKFAYSVKGVNIFAVVVDQPVCTSAKLKERKLCRWDFILDFNVRKTPCKTYASSEVNFGIRKILEKSEGQNFSLKTACLISLRGLFVSRNWLRQCSGSLRAYRSYASRLSHTPYLFVVSKFVESLTPHGWTFCT